MAAAILAACGEKLRGLGCLGAHMRANNIMLCASRSWWVLGVAAMLCALDGMRPHGACWGICGCMGVHVPARLIWHNNSNYFCCMGSANQPLY